MLPTSALGMVRVSYESRKMERLCLPAEEKGNPRESKKPLERKSTLDE